MTMLPCVLLSLLSVAGAESCEADDMRLQLLQHKVELSRREDKIPAVVSAMYTFGAPAVSRPAMPDLNQPDRCFRGLRTYTETRSGLGGVNKQHLLLRLHICDTNLCLCLYNIL